MYHEGYSIHVVLIGLYSHAYIKFSMNISVIIITHKLSKFDLSAFIDNTLLCNRYVITPHCPEYMLCCNIA